MRVAFLSLLLCFAIGSFGQRKGKVEHPIFKFGDIRVQDFQPKFYQVDTGASAVILADLGTSRFIGNNDGFFSIEFWHHRRMRIMNKNGFDAASFTIYLYSEGRTEEKLDDLEVVTYNLEGDKVVATKLDKGSVFKDRLNKYYIARKFTFPNLKEGSILEYRYKVTSPSYRNLRKWEFQGSLPRLWSEYTVMVPSMFDFVQLSSGYRKFKIASHKTFNETYHIVSPSRDGRTELLTWSGIVNERTWAIENMPALKREPFTSAIENHTQKIEFQLNSIRWPNGNIQDVMGSWSSLLTTLMTDEDFGGELNKGNHFLDSELKKVTEGSRDDKEKAARIFAYVRDNYTCTDHSAVWMSNKLRKTHQSKNGNVADINLLLIAMLRSQGIDALPVILSTSDHGKIYELYPLLNKFNYVIAQVKVDNKVFYLDASRSRLGFGRLPSDAYNGYARILEEPVPTLIDLSPNSLLESKVTNLFISNKEGQGMTAAFSSTPGYFESYSLRNKLAKSSQEEYFKNIKKTYSMEVELTNGVVDAVDDYDKPVTVKYDFDFDFEEDIVYFNPMLGEATKDNPFSSAERYYPVEMPYSISEVYVLNMDVPTGYKVDEMPKSTRVKLNEDEGMFEYIITQSGNSIQFRSKITVNRAVFDAEDYQILRDFFAMIVKKHSEQIVFKKIAQ